MSLISEYLKKISEKQHSSEHDTSIPPMLFDNNHSNLNKKKKLKKYTFMGILFLLAILSTGYFFMKNQPSKEIRKTQNFQKAELMPVHKEATKPEPVMSEVKQNLAKQQLAEIDQLTIHIDGGDKPISAGSIDKSTLYVEANRANDKENIEFQKRQIQTGYKLYFNLGLSAQKDKNYNKAEKYYKKSLNIKSDYKKSLINLSAIYIKIGDTNKAIASLQKLISIDPDNSNAYVNLGIAYLKQKNFKQAEEILAGAVEKDQNNIISLYNLAVLYQKTDQLDKAANIYERIMKIDPENIKSCLACSSIYEKRKDFIKAKENYKKCLAITKINQSYKLKQKILYRMKLIQAIIETKI